MQASIGLKLPLTNWRCCALQRCRQSREEDAGRPLHCYYFPAQCCVTVQMELRRYPEPVQAMLQKLLAAAAPSAPVPMHWRYSLMSLAMFLFIMPPIDAASAKVCTACAPVAEPGMASCPDALLAIPTTASPNGLHPCERDHIRSTLLALALAP